MNPLKGILIGLGLTIVGFGCSPSKSGSNLPDTWTKDFEISLYTGGGMADEALNITFTFDSCLYIQRNGMEKTIHSFPLTEVHRTGILDKMKALRLDQTRSEQTSITYDKESNRICFYNQKEYCFGDGATSEIYKDDQTNFFNAYRYLFDFASRKGKTEGE